MKIVGGILIAIGILIAGLSGLCSLLGLAMLIGDGNLLGSVGFVLLYGGIPFAIGVGLVSFGRSLCRNSDSDRFDGS